MFNVRFRSTPTLQDLRFDNKAVSLNISGNCAWIACDETDYGGRNVTLMPGREYGGLPGEIHKSISSLRMVAQEQVNQVYRNHAGGNYQGHDNRVGKQPNDMAENSVARLWAFVTIRDILDRAAENDITKIELEKAYSLAMRFHFLTPFTIMNFVQSNLFTTQADANYIKDPVEPRFLTYGDLSPIFYNGGIIEKWEKLKKCELPIQCEGKYHIEKYIDNTDKADNMTNGFEVDGVNCTGTIKLYTKSNYTGEELRIEGESIYQLYHEINGQTIRSIKAEGECCWNLFDKLFFAARNIKRICGDEDEPQTRINVGSIKRNK